MGIRSVSNLKIVRTTTVPLPSKRQLETDAFYVAFAEPTNYGKYEWLKMDQQPPLPLSPEGNRKLREFLEDIKFRCLAKTPEAVSCRLGYMGNLPFPKGIINFNMSWINDHFQLVVEFDNFEAEDAPYSDEELCINELSGGGFSCRTTIDGISPWAAKNVSLLLRRLIEEPKHRWFRAHRK